jgi:hypothetical protein
MGRFYRSFGGMCWPAPSSHLGDLSHKLTYGEPTKEELLVCASVINAYQHMIRLSAVQRAGIIRELRLGPNGPMPERCHAARDGECSWAKCPQIKDGEPAKSGRHCPHDNQDEDE